MNFSKKHFAALFTALILWGFSFPAMKFAMLTDHASGFKLDPVTLLFYRYLFAFLILIPLVIKKSAVYLPVYKKNKSLLWLGVFGFLGMIFQITGIDLSTSTKSAIITQLIVAVVPVLAYFILKEMLNIRKIFSIILSFSGSVILSTGLDFSGFSTANSSTAGDLLIVVSVVFWALYIVYTRKFAGNFSSVILLIPSVIIIFLFSGTITLARNNFMIDSKGIWISLFLSIFCTIIPTLLYNYASESIDAVSSTALGPVESVSAAVLSIAFLPGENLTPVEYFGGFLVLLSVYILAFNIKRRRRVRVMK